MVTSGRMMIKTDLLDLPPTNHTANQGGVSCQCGTCKGIKRKKAYYPRGTTRRQMLSNSLKGFKVRSRERGDYTFFYYTDKEVTA